MNQPIGRAHRNQTMYDDMAFPDYEYREFPMAVPVLDGVMQDSPYNEKGKPHPVVIVNNEAELALLRRQDAPLVPLDYEAQASRVETEDDVRERLFVRADQLGVKVDRRWSVERIQKTISEAETLV